MGLLHKGSFKRQLDPFEGLADTRTSQTGQSYPMKPKSFQKPPIVNKNRAPSSQRWQLQTAKAQFSEVFRRARERAPQIVTRQDKEAVVIVAIEEFERLTHRAAQPKSLSKFFADSPLAGSGIKLERKPDHGRAVEL